MPIVHRQKVKISVTLRWCTFLKKNGHRFGVNEYLIEGLYFPRIIYPRKRISIATVDRSQSGEYFVAQRRRAFSHWSDKPGYTDGACELSIDEMLDLAASLPGMFFAEEILFFRHMNDVFVEKARARSVLLAQAHIHVRPKVLGVAAEQLNYKYRRNGKKTT